MPELARFADAQGDHGVQVLGLALDTADDVRGFLRRVPVEYPIVIETRGAAMPVQLGNGRACCLTACCSMRRGGWSRRSWGPFAQGEIDRWVK